jgi:PAS domain S-box-containing protein
MQTNNSQRLERSILLGAAVIDLLLIVAVLFFFFQSYTHFNESVRVTRHNLVQLLEQRIGDKARLVDDAVVRVQSELEHHLQSGGIDSERLQKRLSQEQQQLPEIDAIRVTNVHGDVVWGKGVTSASKANYADRDFFTIHQQNRCQGPILTPPIEGRVSGLWVIAFTRCYRTPEGAFAGIVSAAVPVDSFTRLLRTVNLGARETAVIRYEDGGLIARIPTLEGEIGQPGNKMVSREFIELLASGKPIAEFQTRQSPDAVERSYLFHRVTGWPFLVAVGLVAEDYLQPWRMQVIWGLVLLGILLLMTSTLAWVTIRYLRGLAIREKEREEDLSWRRILIDQSLDGIVVLERQGRVWEANQRFAQMLGYSPEETAQLYVWDWDAQWSRAELQTMIDQVGADGAHFETRHRRKDGQLIDVEISTNSAEFEGSKLIFCVCRDVSERNQARQALKASEEKYRIIFENQLYAVTVFDLQTYRLLDVNEAFVRLYGYSREELLGGMTILDLSAEPEQSQAAILEATDRGEIFVPLRYQRRKDGTVVSVEIVGGPCQWNGRKVMFTLAHDITIRKQAEDELREREALYRFLIAGLSDGFFVCDAQGVLTSVNEALTHMCGAASPGQLVGRSLLDFVAPVDQERVAASFNQAVAQLIVPPFLEVVLLREDGRELYAEVKPTVVVRDQGLVAIQGLVFDVTRKKREADALKKSEERLHLALQATRDAVWDWDLRTDSLYYSPRWFAMIGYEAEELQVDPTLWRRLLHPDDLERADQVVAEAIAAKTFFEIETRLQHKDGHYVPVLTRGYILRDEFGQTIRLAGANTDLTDQKRIEEERLLWERQALQLQKAESLSRMAGAIAHHFNNLLGVVLGNLEIALEDLPADLAGVSNLKAAAGAGDRAVEVSSLLLTYLGQTEGLHELLDLAQLYRSGLPQLQALLTGEIALETRFPNPGPVVRGNGDHLQRLLKNLVVNAVEAIGERPGAIGLSLVTVSGMEIPQQQRFPFDWDPGARRYACLKVQDSGIGIASADIEQLFDPFFSSKFTGRGLGLSVVMGVVRAHGGGIVVHSTPRVGSTFLIYLPLPEQDEMLQTAGEAPVKLTRERTVLLVEDEEQVRMMMEVMLSRLGFAYRSAEDGVEALAMFRQQSKDIDLVVCDLAMPSMDGWEIMEALREISPQIPFIMISGYDQAQAMGEGRSVAPQVFLQKPFKKEELHAAIEAALK